METQAPVVVKDVIGIRQVGDKGFSQHLDIIGSDGTNRRCWSSVESLVWDIKEDRKTVEALIVTTDHGDFVTSQGTITGPLEKVMRFLEKLGYATLLEEEEIEEPVG